MRTGKLFLVALAVGAGGGILSLLRDGGTARAAGKPAEPPVKATGQRIILCFGDSLTASKYWTHIKTPAGVLINGQGWGGQQIAAILKNSKPVVAKVKPTDVVLLAGVNNIASGHKDERVCTDLQAAWDYYHSQGARVIAVKLTPWFGYAKFFGKGKKTAQPMRDITNTVNKYIEMSAGQPGGPDGVVDTASMGDENGALKKEYSAGGLHLSKGGQKALAALVAKAL